MAEEEKNECQGFYVEMCHDQKTFVVFIESPPALISFSVCQLIFVLFATVYVCVTPPLEERNERTKEEEEKKHTSPPTRQSRSSPSSSSMICLMALAGNSPSVLNAGLSLSMPTKTSVGRP